MPRDNPGIPWLVVVPILFALFSAFLIKPIQLPPVPALSAKHLPAKADLAYDIQIQADRNEVLAQNPTPSPLSSPALTPTIQPRPAQERNPGLVVGGVMIALIIVLGLLRFSRRPRVEVP